LPWEITSRVCDTGGEKTSEDNEILKNLFKLLEEIANREKRKSIRSNDYGSAFMLAVLEGIFKQASLTPT